MSIYDYSVSKPSGEEVSLGDYKGKVMLIVNTATGCGFTPQYKDIEKVLKSSISHATSSQVRLPEQMMKFTSSALFATTLSSPR